MAQIYISARRDNSSPIPQSNVPPRPAGCPLVEDIFGDLSMCRKLGQGTYALLGLDPGAPVYALKHHLDPPATSARTRAIIRARTLRELQFLLRRNSDHVVKVYDILTDKQGDLYGLFEFCKFDLHRLREVGIFNARSRPAWARACATHYLPEGVHGPLRGLRSAMRQVLQGLADLHGAGIAHRDLKPANVFVTESGECRIGDLGMAQVLDRLDDATAAADALLSELEQGPYEPYVCTSFYRAPELSLLSHVYDMSCDMWSMGILFTELLCGEPVTYPGRAAAAPTPADPRPDYDRMALDTIFRLLGRPTPTGWEFGSRLLKASLRRGEAVRERPNLRLSPAVARVDHAYREWRRTFHEGSEAYTSIETAPRAEQVRRGQTVLRGVIAERMHAHHVGGNERREDIYYGCDLAALNLRTNELLEGVAKAFGESRDDISAAVDLASRMLAMNPADRLTVDAALAHPFFANSKPESGPDSFQIAVSIAAQQQQAPQQPASPVVAAPAAPAPPPAPAPVASGPAAGAARALIDPAKRRRLI